MNNAQLIATPRNRKLSSALKRASMYTNCDLRDVAHALSVSGHATAPEIARATGIHPTTVHFTLNHLRDLGIAREQTLAVAGEGFLWCLTAEEWLAN